MVNLYCILCYALQYGPQLKIQYFLNLFLSVLRFPQVYLVFCVGAPANLGRVGMCSLYIFWQKLAGSKYCQTNNFEFNILRLVIWSMLQVTFRKFQLTRLETLIRYMLFWKSTGKLLNGLLLELLFLR